MSRYMLSGEAMLGSGALLGVDVDLGLIRTDTDSVPPISKSSRLSWVTSMFYSGMLAGLHPSIFLAQRYNRGRVLGIVVCF